MSTSNQFSTDLFWKSMISGSSFNPSTDSGDYVILLLLDLTAAFDRVDYDILISRLQHLMALLWVYFLTIFCLTDSDPCNEEFHRAQF